MSFPNVFVGNLLKVMGNIQPEVKINNTKIVLVRGDITVQDTDAIVNTANSGLLGGGGVDGAIHRAGGTQIFEQCKQIRQTRLPDGLPAGESVITSGGKLKAKYVIHTVGPVWAGGRRGEETLLTNCYWNSLNLAVKNGMKSIAFPSISTGVYGYPIEKAAKVAYSAVKEFLLTEKHNITEVRFIVFSDYDFQIYSRNIF